MKFSLSLQTNEIDLSSHIHSKRARERTVKVSTTITTTTTTDRTLEDHRKQPKLRTRPSNFHRTLLPKVDNHSHVSIQSSTSITPNMIPLIPHLSIARIPQARVRQMLIEHKSHGDAETEQETQEERMPKIARTHGRGKSGSRGRRWYVANCPTRK